jgi:broad specificity phosphatase PhoE
MGTLYLVRHGQASFGAEDYDQLSELGRRQSVRLGEYLAAKGITFDAVLTGTLRRHAQTWDGIAEGAALDLQPLLFPGLNEYDSHAVIEAVHPLPLGKPDTPELYRHHFRLLRDGLAQWMAGVVSPRGMPAYVDFVRGITSALDHVRQHYTGNVLLVSSGGPHPGHAGGNHHRAEHAHPQQRADRVRVQPEAPHAADLQRAAAPGPRRLQGLGELRLNGHRCQGCRCAI